MKSISFMQYLKPDGRKRPILIERPDDIVEKSEAITDEGYRFETEILTTGEVSVTIFDPTEEVDVAIEICRNGPGVGEAVDRMINEFTAELAAKH